METIELPVQVRDLSKRAKDLRRDGRIPAVYYGHGQKNLSLEIDYQAFFRVYRDAGESTIIDLKLEGSTKPLKVLVQDTQVDPVSDKFVHVDFINVKMDEEITTKVPLGFVGEASAVKDLDGILTTNKNEVEIKCFPQNLPSQIEVDISSLVDFHVVIKVSDLVLPSGVAILDDAEGVVATVTAPREEEEEEEVPVEGEEAEEEAKEGEEAEAKEGEEKEGEEKAEEKGEKEKKEEKK